MNIESPFEGPPEDTREEILRAAFLVIQQHGYDGLSMSRVADEVGIQKSSVYHHYQDKDSLLLSLADYVIGEIKYRIMQPEEATPTQQLQWFIDHIVFGQSVTSESAVSPPSQATLQVFSQIQSQATHTNKYQEKLTTIEKLQQKHLIEILQNGINEGEFYDVNVEQVSSFLTTFVNGVLFGRVTTNTDLEPARKAVHEYLQSTLIN